jgi:hypothetical protein
VSGAVIDLVYDYAKVVGSSVTNPKFTDPNTGDPADVWQLVTRNLQGATANGRIALVADPSQLGANPIVDASGKVLSVTLTVEGLVSSFAVGLESKAVGGATEVTTANNVAHAVDVGVTKLVGSAAGVLKLVQDGTTLGAVGDNEFRMLSTFDATTNLTRFQIRYDKNAAVGASQIQASDLIELEFVGDVTNVLIPPSLLFPWP